jgi:hypothetical protein
MNTLRDALLQALLDVATGFVFLTILCVVGVLALWLWGKWDDRNRRHWREICDNAWTVHTPPDFGGEIRAHKLARDHEEERSAR